MPKGWDLLTINMNEVSRLRRVKINAENKEAVKKTVRNPIIIAG